MTVMRWSMLGLLAWCLLGRHAGAQLRLKPDFAGIWTLARDKTDFGPTAPADITCVIDNQGSTIRLRESSNGRTLDWTFWTDGRESINTIDCRRMKSTLQWEGDSLSISTKMGIDGNEVTVTQRWELVDGGQTLIMSRNTAGRGREIRQRLVFVRQSGTQTPPRTREVPGVGPAPANVISAINSKIAELAKMDVRWPRGPAMPVYFRSCVVDPAFCFGDESTGVPKASPEDLIGVALIFKQDWGGWLISSGNRERDIAQYEREVQFREGVIGTCKAVGRYVREGTQARVQGEVFVYSNGAWVRSADR